MLRFLGGCEEGEMTEFIKLLTLPFQELKSEIFVYCIKTLWSALDIVNCLV